ncbi:unnamed protein product [Paramecium sonneborni]|uniref:Uncharacterized protein n=1 Tax=Paramecium sonneborni TaxID=65129 RepID=A0A8S1LYP5_9CILI|nr:unnamed protein product [Paramecium sonneborni]
MVKFGDILHQIVQFQKRGQQAKQYVYREWNKQKLMIYIYYLNQLRRCPNVVIFKVEDQL